jgi:hypothetical protein
LRGVAVGRGDALAKAVIERVVEIKDHAADHRTGRTMTSADHPFFRHAEFLPSHCKHPDKTRPIRMLTHVLQLQPVIVCTRLVNVFS